MSEGVAARLDVPAPTALDHEFRQLLEKLPAAACTCDAEGLITYFNRRAAEVWGREPRLHDPADRWCGSFRLFTSDGEPIAHDQCWMARALREDREHNGREIVIERPDGERITALAHANPIHDAHGRLTGAVNVLIDISDQKRAQALLRDADRRKTEFLATLAHELRNPLAPITNSLEILKMAGDDLPLAARARGMIERQVAHMARLVDDLLDVSRISSNKLKLRLERVELGGILHAAIETSRPVSHAAGVNLTLTMPDEPVVLLADPVRVTQVVSNLLHNACKFTPAGGRITVTAARRVGGVDIAVRDTGIGIPAAMLSRIFDIFAQVDRTGELPHGGLGIGLSLVRALVEFHGGSIRASSEGANQGSTFVVHLPVPVDVEAPRIRSATAAVTEHRGRRVLVVDDHADAALSLAMLLRLAGNDVRVVHDGHAAIAETGAFRPDVVLMDIGMPRLDGYEACRRLRAEPWGGEPCLIALTGWGQQQDRRRAEEAGFDGHLLKPVDPAALTRLIAELPPRTAGPAPPARERRA